MPNAPAKKPNLKLRKSSTGTKHTVNERKPLLGKGYRIILNSKTPKKGEWTPKQLERLKKIGKENAKVRKSQQGVLEEYYKKSKSPVYNREPVYKPRGVFVNVPISEIRLDSKIGIIIFKQNLGPGYKTHRITRAELLKDGYYKEANIFNDLLESRKYSSEETTTSVKKRIETKKQKIIDVARFLDLHYLKNAGISIDRLITAKFTLPEILQYGGYSQAELETHFNREKIKEAQKYNSKKTHKFYDYGNIRWWE